MNQKDKNEKVEVGVIGKKGVSWVFGSKTCSFAFFSVALTFVIVLCTESA